MANTFNFECLKKKYDKQGKKKEEQQLKSQERLRLKQQFVLNPFVQKEIKKVEKDYITYYNNNRYFYVHNDPQNIDMIQKIKNDQFSKIRKKYQITLINDKQQQKEKVKVKDNLTKKSKRKQSKNQNIVKFKYLSYLFRKNIRLIINKLKNMKITVKDIFQKKLFCDEAYCFGKQIFTAVKSGDETKVWRFFIQNKFVIFSVDSTGKNLLTWACIRGYNAIAQMLIGMGILLNKKDIHKKSPLYYALFYKQAQCVKLLLLNGVCITQQQKALSQQQKKLKNIVQLSISIINIINRMPYDMRKLIFQQRLKNLL